MYDNKDYETKFFFIVFIFKSTSKDPLYGVFFPAKLQEYDLTKAMTHDLGRRRCVNFALKIVTVLPAKSASQL